MLRICLIVVIVAGLGTAAITLTKVQEIITSTRAERDDWHQKDTQEIAEHTKTKATLKTTQGKLDKTEKELTQTKSDLDGANAKVDELNTKNTDLSAKLDKANADRDDAQQKLEAWNLLHLTPDQIKGIVVERDKAEKAVAALNIENHVLNTKVNDLSNYIASYFGPDQPVILPAGLRGKILAVDPKYDFVVLNIGEDQGAKVRGEMMVDKDGKLLGKIRITTVQKDRCVANILPQWKRGEIMEGDEVLY